MSDTISEFYRQSPEEQEAFFRARREADKREADEQHKRFEEAVRRYDQHRIDTALTTSPPSQTTG